MKQVRTRRGVRLVQGDAVLSEILSKPGPTHSVFDVLAITVATLARGPRIALLGFAGGGVVAPLRASGFDGPVDAVDLSALGDRVFRRLSSDWCGDVRFTRIEAVRWLRGLRRSYDVIVEDLSVPGPDGVVTKPQASIDVLPALIRACLGREGVMIANLLPVEDLSWKEMLGHVRAPYRAARVVMLEEFENRILVASRSLPSARRLSLALRERMRQIRSRMAWEISVRDLPRPRPHHASRR